MLESPLPSWVRAKLPEMIEAYESLLPLLQERCEAIAARGWKNGDGELCDAAGTLDEYRLDAKYAAGQSSRMSRLMLERIQPEQRQTSTYYLSAKDATTLAEWAWRNPWKTNRVRVPITPFDEAPMAWKDFYLLYPVRERQALVYTLGCGLSLRETAAKMNISVRRVRDLLDQARSRGNTARDRRAGITGKHFTHT